MKKNINTKLEIYKNDNIFKLCKNKTVLHIGAACSPSHLEMGKKNQLLHQKLNKIAKDVVGLDYDKKAIDELRKIGINNIFYGDIIKGNFKSELDKIFDVILVGDVIEHLDNPGLALSNIFELANQNSIIILTTPNVWSLFRIKNIFFKDEEVHNDHMFWPSRKTMNRLILKNNFEILDFNYCFYGTLKENSTWKSKLFFKLFKNSFPQIRTCLFYILKLKFKRD